MISFWRFKREAKKVGLRYNQPRRSPSNSPAVKLQRILFFGELQRRFKGGEKRLSFDTTTFNAKAFKRKMWMTRSNPPSTKRWLSSEYVHLLVLIEINGLVDFQLVTGNINSERVAVFLHTAIKYFRSNNDDLRQLHSS